jgi:hypothetical protein
MPKQLVVRMQYEDEIRKIAATAVTEERGRLVAFNGAEKVAAFPLDKIEYWCLEEVADFIKPDPASHR